MGALHKLDLTSDVTHLIVGDTDTPKYKFVAKERPDVKCLLPSWIDAVRQSWLDGGETKVEALEAEHKVPTFYGLRICVTGFEDCMLYPSSAKMSATLIPSQSGLSKIIRRPRERKWRRVSRKPH